MVDHCFEKDILSLKVTYLSNYDLTSTLTVPFGVLKKDLPLELVCYTKEHAIDKRRGGFYNNCDTKKLKGHNRLIRRIYIIIMWCL